MNVPIVMVWPPTIPAEIVEEHVKELIDQINNTSKQNLVDFTKFLDDKQEEGDADEPR